MGSEGSIPRDHSWDKSPRRGQVGIPAAGSHHHLAPRACQSPAVLNTGVPARGGCSWAHTHTLDSLRNGTNGRNVQGWGDFSLGEGRHRRQSYLGELPVPKPLHPAHARDSLALGRGSVGDDDRRPPGETFDLAPDELPNSKFLPILKRKRTTRISQKLKLPISSQHPCGRKAEEHPEALLYHLSLAGPLHRDLGELQPPLQQTAEQPRQRWLPALPHCQPHAEPSAWHTRHGACCILHSPPGTGTPCVPSPACPLLPALPGSRQAPGSLFLPSHKPAAAKLRLSAAPAMGMGQAGGRQLQGAQGHCGCYVSLALRLLPRLPEQTRLLPGTSFTGLRAQLVWLRPGERAPPSSCSHRGEQQTGEKKSWELWCD